MSHPQELKNCPFCGNPPESYTPQDIPGDDELEGPLVYCDTKGCIASLSPRYAYEWNTRSDTTARDALVQARDALNWARVLIKFHVKPDKCVEIGEDMKSAEDIHNDDILRALEQINAVLGETK